MRTWFKPGGWRVRAQDRFNIGMRTRCWSACRNKGVNWLVSGPRALKKPFSERYKLQRFGRGGFVSAALRDEVPDHSLRNCWRREITTISNAKTLVAQFMESCTSPITLTFPWLGLVPLPEQVDHQFADLH